MNIKQIVNESLNAPMTRKDFLGRMGGLLLAVTGGMSILHALAGHIDPASGGYGSTPYGGRSDA